VPAVVEVAGAVADVAPVDPVAALAVVEEEKNGGAPYHGQALPSSLQACLQA